MNDYLNIENHLRSLFKSLKIKRTIGSALCFFTVFAASFLFLSAAESLFYLSRALRFSFLAAGVIGGITGALLFLRKYPIPAFSGFYREAADKAGIPGLKHLLDLQLTDRLGPSTLKQAAIEQNLQHVSQANFKKQLESVQSAHPVSRFFRLLLPVSIVLLLILPILGWVTTPAMQRSIQFWQEYQRPIPFEFFITPGDTTVEQGSQFQAFVRFKDAIPNHVRLGIRTDQEQQHRLQGMSRSNDTIFSSREINLFEDIEFYIDMDGYKSPSKRIRVEALPRLQDFMVITHPPSYTEIQTDTIRYPFNRIEVVSGSDMEITANSNKPLHRLSLVSELSLDTLSLSPDSVINKRLTLETDERFHFNMVDQYGLENSNPFRFRVVVNEDRPPMISILSPDRYVHDFITEEVPLLYEYEDDFGFTSLSLHYRYYKAFVDQPVEGSTSLPLPNRLRGLGEFDWDISSFKPGAMDRVEYWLEITDNNDYGGYQTSRSSVHVIEIPSLASRMFDQEEKEEDIDNRFTQVEESYRQMRDDIRRLRQEIQINPENEWEQSQILEEIGEQRQDIEQQIEDLKKSFEELTQDMGDQDLMSEETMRQYQELQKLLDEIDDPDLLELLDMMQQNLEHMDQRQLREQLDQIEFNEEQYRERLERTLELFKTLRLNSDLEKMSRMLEDLQEQEAMLSENEAQGEEEIRQQEAIREQFQKIMEQLHELPDRSPQRRMEQIQELRDHMLPDMERLDKLMEETLENMSDPGGDPSQTQDQQQDISQEMGEMSQQLSNIRQQMQQQAISINIQALKYILETLILLSEEQEDVVDRTGSLTPNSPGFIEQARRQRAIRTQFASISDSLYRVSSEIPQFSNRINDRKHDIELHMERSLQFLIERNRSRASTQQRTALAGLNEIGTMVADLLDQLDQMSGGDGEGQLSLQQMMDQMQQMSQDQQQLNQQIQDFINDMQGERLTRDHMERLEQLARQQNEIREQLRRMQRQGGGEGDRLMSEIERLAEEMEEAINDLRGGSTDDIMVHRQQHILSRMLEVEESIYKRDEDEEERLGETAGEYEPRTTGELSLEELRQRIRSGVEQANYSRFKEEYQRLIERYFQLMEDYLDQPATPSGTP